MAIQAGDTAGNWSESGILKTIIDLTPPTPPIVLGEKETTNPMPRFTWDVSDDKKNYKWRMDKGLWNRAFGNINFYIPNNPLPIGNHVFEISAEDEAGNWSEPSAFNFTIKASTQN